MEHKNQEHPVTVEEMMSFRDARVEIQTVMRKKHGTPVLSFCMNIPGEIKTGERIRRAFEAGLRLLRSRFDAEGIVIAEETERHETAGDEWIAAVNAPAYLIKEIATSIEETHPCGRLFDMDVLDETGRKLSRNVPRRCLICEEEATVCARSRRHHLTQLREAVDRILQDEKSAQW